MIYMNRVFTQRRDGVLTTTDVQPRHLKDNTDDVDRLLVPLGPHPSQPSTSSSALEVEDCEDLEVVGVDSGTNVVESATWNKDAQRQNPGSDDETDVIQIQELNDISADRDGKRAGSTDKRNDYVADDSDNAVANQPSFTASHLMPGKSGEISGVQCERTENPAHTAAATDDDFDDSEGDDEATDLVVKPTFSPFCALISSAGGDHRATRTETKTAVEDKEDMLQDCRPAAATVATPIATESVQSFYGTNSDDEDALNDADEDDDDDDDDDIPMNDSTAVPGSVGISSTRAADSAEHVLAGNSNSKPQTVGQNGVTGEIDATTGDGISCSKLSPDHERIEDLNENRIAPSRNLVEDDQGRWTSSTTKSSNRSDDSDGSDLDEDVEIFGDKNGIASKDQLGVVTSTVETKSAGSRSTDCQAKNEVRRRDLSV